MEGERDALLATEHTVTPAPAAMLLNLKGIGPEFAAILWSEGLFRHFANHNRSPLMQALRQRPGRADRSIGSKASRKPAIRDCARQ